MIHTRRSSGVLITVILTCILTAISAPPVSASPEEIAPVTGNSMKLPLRAQAPSFDPVTESLRATNIDSLIEAQMASGHVAGLSACIAYDLGMFWTSTYGMANFDTDTAVGYGTLFMLASISKIVTATALMQLWEDGLFNLDDDVSDYLPFTVTNPNFSEVPITFRMLLTHSSSIRDNWGVMPYYDGDSPLPLGEYLADYLVPGGAYYSANSYFNWEPGTNWFYCNNGFALAAYLVETIGGQSFPEHCRQEIFTPLGMDETEWHLADLNQNHIAMPYRWSGSAYVPFGHYGYSDYPSGQLRTSANQLAQFLLAYIHDGEWNGAHILDAATVDLMLTPQIPGINPDQGLAWRRWGDYWYHNGGDQGANTTMYFNRVEMRGVVVLTNGENSAVTSDIADQLYAYGGGGTAVDETASSAPGFQLLPAYPNPFNPVTTITYHLANDGPVQIAIFDARGRKVYTLFSGREVAGTHRLNWNGYDDSGRLLSSGLYFCQGVGAEETVSCHLLLLK